MISEEDYDQLLSGTKICFTLPAVKSLEGVLGTIEEYIFRYQALPTSIVAISKATQLDSCDFKIEMISPFPTPLLKNISIWPNRKRGELCLRDFAAIDDLMSDSPLFESFDSRHQLSVKSSTIKEDSLKALVVLSIIIEHSDRDDDVDHMEQEQEEGLPDGIPIHLRRQEFHRID
jgi:hypothetical protein